MNITPLSVTVLHQDELAPLADLTDGIDFVAEEGKYCVRWVLCGREIILEQYHVKNGVKIPQWASVAEYASEAIAEQVFAGWSRETQDSQA